MRRCISILDGRKTMESYFRSARMIRVLAAVLFAAAAAYGKDITLVWSSNTEADLAGYKVYRGSASRRYDTVIDVGAITTYTFRGLADGVHFFAVTAYNRAGLESDFSNEVFDGPLTLFYPRLAAFGAEGMSASQYTGVALANLDQAAAFLRLTAFDRDGTEPAGADIVNPVVLSSLDAGRQYPFLDYQLFGSGLQPRSPVGWARIESTVRGVSGLFLFFDAALSLLDGGSMNGLPLASSVIGAIKSDGFTHVSLINPNSFPVEATLDLVAADGVSLRSVRRTLAAMGSTVEELAADLFPGTPLSPSSYVRVEAPAGLLVSEATGRPGSDFEFLHAHDARGGSARLYAPQYAVGSGWRSAISLVNLAPISGEVTLRLIGEDGGELGARVVPIAARGKIHVDDPFFFGNLQASVAGGPVQGYVEVAGSGLRLVGHITFGDAGGRFSAALPLVASLQDNAIFGHVASSRIWYTGLAVVNPGTEDIEGALTVYEADGTPALSRILHIPAGRRVSGLLTQLFPLSADDELVSGYMRLTAGRPVAAFALFGTNEGSVLAAIPAQGSP